jgi:hypothetical protein
MSDAQAGRTADRRHRLPGWLRFGLIAVASLLAAGAAFLLAAASFGILSLPIVIVGLVIGGIARSPWARWPALSAVLSVVGMYLFLWLTGR